MSTEPLLKIKTGDAQGPHAPPFAIIFRLLALVLTLANIPYWLVYYYVARPKAYSGPLTYAFGRFFYTMSVFYPFLPSPEAEGEAARLPKMAIGLNKDPWTVVKKDVVPIQPVPKDWRVAYCADVPAVKAVERPGFMLTPPGSKGKGAEHAKDGECIIMNIHGGAYIQGHPVWVPIVGKLARDTNLRVLCVQYRKCLDEASAYPAPLLDAMAAWRYLTVTLGFPAENIILAGDSAGGHCSLAVLRQLHAQGLPLPGGVALSSPWTDFTSTFDSWKRNTDDILSRGKLLLAVKSVTRHYDKSEVAGEFFSPAFAPPGHWEFLAKTPVFMSYGTEEAFEDEIRATAKSMRADGVDVKLFEDVDGLHDAPVLPFQPEKAYQGYLDGLKDVLHKAEAKNSARK